MLRFGGLATSFQQANTTAEQLGPMLLHLALWEQAFRHLHLWVQLPASFVYLVLFISLRECLNIIGRFGGGGGGVLANFYNFNGGEKPLFSFFFFFFYVYVRIPSYGGGDLNLLKNVIMVFEHSLNTVPYRALRLWWNKLDLFPFPQNLTAFYSSFSRGVEPVWTFCGQGMGVIFFAILFGTSFMDGL